MKKAFFKGPIAWMAQNSVAVNMCLLLLLLGGFIQLSRVKQEIFPEFTMDFITISSVYKGASPNEVESGIVLAIEEAARSVDGVKKLKSTAAEGLGVVTAELLFGADPDKVAEDIKNTVNQIKTFPKDAEKPIVKRLSARNEVISLILYGNQDEKTLRSYAELVREELLAHSKITTVELIGVKEKEISVEIPQNELVAHNLTLQKVAQKISQASVELPTGQIKAPHQDISLRLKGRFKEAHEYENVTISQFGAKEKILLKDIAQVKKGFEEADISSTYNGFPAVMVKVFRSGEQKPTEIAKQVKAYEKNLIKKLPQGINVAIWNDYADILTQRIDLLISNAIMGLILVFFVLGLFLELRLAFWVTMGIPTSFLGTFLFLPLLGISVNMISLFAFIIVLGMVVDDAIVVGENIYSHRLKGEPLLYSAIRGVREISMPVVFAVLTTVAAFFPLFFVPGVMGKFFYVIPAIVIIVLGISLFESIFMLPNHLAHTRFADEDNGVLKYIHNKQQIFSGKFMNFVDKYYRFLVRYSIQNRYISLSLGLSLLILVIAYIASGRLEFTFMPKMDSDIVLLHAEYPVGTGFEQSKELEKRIILAANEALEKLGGKEKSKGIYSQVGSSLNPGGPVMGKMGEAGSHICEVMVALMPSDQRKFSSDEFSVLWEKEIGEVAKLKKITFKSTTGPDTGKAVSLNLKHQDTKVLEENAKQLAKYLRSYAGLSSIEDGITEGKSELLFKLKGSAYAVGTSSIEVASQVRDAFYGAESLRRQEGRDEVKVMVRLPKNERNSLYDIENFKVNTPMGFMFLSELALVKAIKGYPQILREDGQRVLTVSADIKEGQANANQVMSDLAKTIIPKMTKENDGLTIEKGGEQKEQSDVLKSLSLGFMLALLMIYALLAIPLKSYLQPLVIMSAIPFGIVGAAIGHILLGYSLSVISIMGIVALAGIVVNDSLVFIHAANENFGPGLDPKDVMADTGVKRFRPILLTSLTTFFGLIPMVLETSMQARFLIPMAVSIAFGVLFSTFITLVLVPALCVILLDIKSIRLNKNTILAKNI